MRTIRQRLTRRLLVLWSCLLLTGAAIAYFTTRAALTRQFDEALRTKAEAVAAFVEADEQGTVQVDHSDNFIAQFDSERNPDGYQVQDSTGKTIVSSHAFPREVSSSTDNRSEAPQYANVRSNSGRPGRVIAVRVVPQAANENQKSSGAGKVTLMVAADRSALNRALTTVALVLAGSGLLVLVATWLTVPRLLRAELLPLNRLAEQAQRINADSLAERFPVEELPGELAPISGRLNDLLGRLETAFARERQFSADLAHEFRTPIAELRAVAELALKWPDSKSPEADRTILAIALQMEAMITRLLAIARQDHGAVSADMQKLNLAGLISSACHPLEAKASARELSLVVQVPADLEIRSDPVLMRSIVVNLLDNAVEYARPGTVQVCSEARNGHFLLRVTNPVDNLDPQDVDRLFDRLWRKDAARSGGEHSGLGLSLARAFATSLGYTLTAKLESEKSLTMTLSGPRQLQPTSPSTNSVNL